MNHNFFNMYVKDLTIANDINSILEDDSHSPPACVANIANVRATDETHILLNRKSDVVNLKTCNQRNLLGRRKKVSIDNVACLNDHLNILKENLFQISCKINELQELKKEKEIEQCRNSIFVCCCLTIYIFCLFCVLFGGCSWLYFLT